MAPSHLPPEIVVEIASALIQAVGLIEATRYRQVCKLFSEEIWQQTLSLRAPMIAGKSARIFVERYDQHITRFVEQHGSEIIQRQMLFPSGLLRSWAEAVHTSVDEIMVTSKSILGVSRKQHPEFISVPLANISLELLNVTLFCITDGMETGYWCCNTAIVAMIATPQSLGRLLEHQERQPQWNQKVTGALWGAAAAGRFDQIARLALILEGEPRWFGDDILQSTCLAIQCSQLKAASLLMDMFEEHGCFSAFKATQKTLQACVKSENIEIALRVLHQGCDECTSPRLCADHIEVMCAASKRAGNHKVLRACVKNGAIDAHQDLSPCMECHRPNQVITPLLLLLKRLGADPDLGAIIEIMLENDVDINEPLRGNRATLWYAVDERLKTGVHSLLDHGADAKYHSEDMSSPFQLAKYLQYTPLACLFHLFVNHPSNKNRVH